MDNETLIFVEKIRIGGVNEHFNLPWIKAAELNNFSCAIEWKNFAGGTGVLTSALRNNEIDLAILLTEGLIIDIIKNKELQLINFHVNNPLRWAVHIRQSDKANFTYAGKRIAISRFGSGSHTMAKFLLGEAISKNTFIEVGSLEGGLNALKNNEADIFLWEKFTTQPFLEENGLMAIDEVRTPWPPFSIASTKRFAKKNVNLILDLLTYVQQVKEDLLNSNHLVTELFNRWNIQEANAKQWMKEIKWHDYSNISLEDTQLILSNMKKVNLLSDSEELISDDIFNK